MNLPENNPVSVSETSDQETIILSQTENLLQSLLHSITHTQSFKGKWLLIQSKLSTLQTLLHDLSDFPPNPISTDLINSLSQTLSQTLSLSITCHNNNINLPNGKLKTQNDVDSVTAKLNNHIHDLECLFNSGVLQDAAVSVSVSVQFKAKASVSVSKRDAVRVEARNLVTRLQIGSVESRTNVLDSLLRLLEEDEKNILIFVAQGVVPVLVRVLSSGFCTEIREKAVIVLAKISSVESSKDVLLAEGLLLLHYLLKVLESGNGIAKEKACVTLQALTLTKENAKAIITRGGISSLLELCQSGTPSSQAAAASVLRNLTVFSDCRESFIGVHEISVLLTLARSGTALAQEHSIACLSNLVKEDDDLKLLIVKKGGLISLKSFWDSASVNSLEAAVELLSCLVSDQRLIDVVVSNDFLIRLVNALSCGVLGVRTHAAEAVYKIGYNSKNRKELGELGFIPVLVKMLDGKSVEEIQAAAKALSTILVYTENRRVYRKDQRGVVSVVRLLDPSIANLDKKYPVSILLSLTHSKKCRKQMVKSGALVHLEKLVAMEVEGAKSLQEAIGGGKLFGVFRIRS